MNKVLVFSLEGNISQKVLEKLQINNKLYLKSDAQYIKDSVLQLLNYQPSYVIGLGEYSGKDKDKLRIETICSNKFRNQIQEKEYEKEKISDFLKPIKNSKLTKGIGNSYCNLVSFLLAKTIRNRILKTKYAFIHIPKNFDLNIATDEINQMINLLKQQEG